MDDSNISVNKNGDKALYFSNWYSGPIKPIDQKKLSRSVKKHINEIRDSKAESVLDLGCGAGGILLALQNAGISEIHGIDASPEAILMAKQRFEKFGTLENTSFTVGDIIDFEPPIVDAVSSHAVICCYPNAVGIVDKATQNKPKMVILTFPKDNLLNKTFTIIENMVLWVIARFNKSTRGRKSYVHITDTVDATFTKNGYELVSSDKGLLWQTLIYKKTE
ncbi:MAG: methyltransferase domain-containing protein [Candidatus Heimdallarchaeota archaeon]|nr:methyltransferase domain-containing protein [Candidatus Heimdallarchaeota archaeon]